MSTERSDRADRSSFGLNAILPAGYMSKAEAFAKCLQDKLRSLGSGEEPSNTTNGRRAAEGSPKTPHGSLTQFSEEEINDNVFLQGPLSYKRRSLPEQKLLSNGKTRGKYIGFMVDKRGMSSDSEESDEDEFVSPSVHPRVALLQGGGDEQSGGALRRLTSVNSVDSTSSWASCEEGPDPEEDVEVMDALAAQIKGSPPIHNPRMRNFKRKSRDDKLKLGRPPPPPPPDADLFFDFDVECFSPVNVEDENEFNDEFQSARLRLSKESRTTWGSELPESVGTGQEEEDKSILELIPNKESTPAVTPPPSPINAKSPKDNDEKVTEVLIGQVSIEDSDKDFELASHDVDIQSTENDSSSSQEDMVKQSLEIESQPETEADDKMDPLHEVLLDQEQVDSNEHDFRIGLDIKDSGICSCDETSSRTGDDDLFEITDSCEIATEQSLSEYRDVEEENAKIDGGTSINKKPPVMVLCDGVEIEENYLPSPRMKLRRCSSLKTWKTPPGTPGRKKIVRFADALGLDLADIRMFLDEVPKIPNSAFEDLHYDIPAPAPPPPVERTLIPMFQQPGTLMDFLQRVRQNNVMLESALLTDVSLLSVSGIVRVRNLSFHKIVHVRYSKDEWKTFSDLQATFVPNSNDGFCDNFSFTLYGHTLNIGDRLEFAIRYDCSAGQFWDSNGGANYVFQCMPRSPMPLFPPLGSSPIDTWNQFY